MTLPAPYQHADDATLIGGIVGGDADALSVFDERHGAILEAVVVRTLDERLGEAGDAFTDAALEAVRAHLFGQRAVRLESFRGRNLVAYLAAEARAETHRFIQNRHTTARPGRGTPPALDALSLATVPPSDGTVELAMKLDRLGPQVNQVMRLRLHGLSASQIAAALGRPGPQVVRELGLIAGQLASITGDEPTWRSLLGAMTPADEVSLALTLDEDAEARGSYEAALQAFRALRRERLEREPEAGPSCLTPADLSTLWDGTLRGEDRALAEGHVAGCAHCADALACLVRDLEMRTAVRALGRRDHPLVRALCLLAGGRFSAALRDAMMESGRGTPNARRLAKVAELGARLNEGTALASSKPPAPTRPLPPLDDEAPLVAFAALMRGEVDVALDALDDVARRSGLGARLALLAQASGADLEAARTSAQELAERSGVDPGHIADASHVLALPEGKALPVRILKRRLSNALLDAALWVITPAPSRRRGYVG